MHIDRLPSHFTRIGVVTDTHIPDRMKELPAPLFEKLRGVDLILHAGDVIQKRIINQIETIAPVLAVQGNLDMITRYGWTLPTDRLIEIGEVRIGLTHGHGGVKGYIAEKLRYHTLGYNVERTVDRVQSRFKDVQAVVFGHTHRPYNKMCNGVLIFNAGSVGPDYYTRYGAGVGIITISDSIVKGEIIPLTD